jgi:HPt (histidine-containing phosphotransfer) domain-containing protein
MANDLAARLLRAMAEEDSSKNGMLTNAIQEPSGEIETTQEFPDIHGVHRQTVVQTTAGNPKIFLKLLRIFCKENQGFSAVLIDEIRQRNYDSVMRRLHNIKGASRYLGALDIEKSAEALVSSIEPYVLARVPLPSSSQAYPIIADIQQAVLNLAKQLGD